MPSGVENRARDSVGLRSAIFDIPCSCVDARALPARSQTTPGVDRRALKTDPGSVFRTRRQLAVHQRREPRDLRRSTARATSAIDKTFFGVRPGSEQPQPELSAFARLAARSPAPAEPAAPPAAPAPIA